MTNHQQLRNTLPLDAAALEARAAALGLKQWWLAEQVGVSSRTMLRWVNGQVGRIAPEHVRRLAELLQCEPEALTLRAASAYASAADQAAAARLIEQETLLDVLTPTSNYELAESLIKAVLRPELPKAHLGRLYGLLALAAGRQFAFERAHHYAALGAAIGTELRNPGIVASARYGDGWALLYAGDCPASAEHFAACAQTFGELGMLREEANARFALGCALWYLALRDEAIDELQRSVELYAGRGYAVDESMALYALAAFTAERGDLAGAGELFQRSLAVSESVAYASGAEKARAGLAWTRAERGEVAEATALFAQVRQNTRGWSFVHPLTFLYGARIAVKANEPKAARAYLEEGLVYAAKFAPERRALERELAALTR